MELGISRFTDKSDRKRVLLSAKLRLGDSVLDVRLRDLSRRGALIETSAPAPVGTNVVFERGATVVPARVAWIRGERMGLSFHEPIEESEVLVHVGRRPGAGQQLPSPPVYYRRPGLAEDLSEGERKLSRTLARTLGVRFPDE